MEGIASAGVRRNCRMRRQQSPRFHPGTNSRILLMASCFLGTEFDAGDQELIYGWQQARVDSGLASNVLDNARHIQNRAASQRAVTGLTTNEAETRIAPRPPRSAMMLWLVLNLPTASLQDAKMGDMLARFSSSSVFFA
jgi:hypothetical protein